MIKKIFDEISAEPGSNKKMEILKKHSGNKLLESVLYAANSKRVKFYIKQIPAYTTMQNPIFNLDNALIMLHALSSREKTGNEAIEYLSKTLSALSK
ncbi:MAG TPA: hypothetical protein VNX68_15675, partial [Nitrosopumilaceae archaeon]|nr:hypothetical protein [Nitrosopumilaceae archaeon]